MIFKSMKVEIEPGTDIRDAVMEMHSLSFLCRCSIDSVFNGVDVFIEPGEAAEVCINRYYLSISRKRDAQGRIVDEVVE